MLARSLHGQIFTNERKSTRRWSWRANFSLNLNQAGLTLSRTTTKSCAKLFNESQNFLPLFIALRPTHTNDKWHKLILSCFFSTTAAVHHSRDQFLLVMISLSSGNMKRNFIIIKVQLKQLTRKILRDKSDSEKELVDDIRRHHNRWLEDKAQLSTSLKLPPWSSSGTSWLSRKFVIDNDTFSFF